MEYKNTDSGFFESTKGRNGAMNVRTAASDIIQPVDIQAHYQQTIQTHTNVIIAPNATSDNSAWIDASGYDSIGLTALNDANASGEMIITWSHDGVNMHGYLSLDSLTARYLNGEVKLRARYFKVRLFNRDTTAPHTFNAWALLKA